MPKVVSTLALATVAAVGLYVTAFAMFGPFGACLRTASATPSPTCSSDLRECLRLSAKTGIYGARYVTAEDVAKCVEAFNACIHGGASGGGDAPPPPPTTGGGKSSLPPRFGIDSEHFAYDCSRNGDAVSCKTTWKTAPAEVDSFGQSITGTLSGLTMSGTATSTTRYHNSAGCSLESTESHSLNFVFNLGGTVAVHSEPFDETVHYTCPTGAGSNNIHSPALDFAATWSRT